MGQQAMKCLAGAYPNLGQFRRGLARQFAAAFLSLTFPVLLRSLSRLLLQGGFMFLFSSGGCLGQL
jgi:hypothetical protein